MDEIYWTEIAQNDLTNIGDYIAKDSEILAVEFVDKIIFHVESLLNFKMIGRVVPEFENEYIREIIFHNYRIIYYLLFII